MFRAGGNAQHMHDGLGLLRHAVTEASPLVRVLGPPADETIEAAQDRLRLRFPDAYRAFVHEFGAAWIGTREVYGIGSSLDVVSGLNVVWHTEQAREHRALSPRLLVLSSWDDLTLEVAEVSDESGCVKDGPVQELLVEGPGEPLADSFTEWLGRTLIEASADADG